MDLKLDLDAYFDRIGYSGPRTATPDVLSELHRLHPKAIAFENLNPFLGIPVSLDLDSLQKKMIDNNRGGYCFEQNLLFKHVLEALGFNVKGLEASILWNVPEGRITPRGHMLLLVETADSTYIADVGFGGLTLTAPLLLKPGLEQETPHENYRLVPSRQGQYILDADIRGKWKSLYRFDLQEQHVADYEVTNWYLSNHPESHFVTGFIAARADNGRRYALLNNKLSVHHLDGKTEKQVLETVSEIREILQTNFHLSLPAEPGLDTVLEQLLKGKEAAE